MGTTSLLKNWNHYLRTVVATAATVARRVSTQSEVHVEASRENPLAGLVMTVVVPAKQDLSVVARGLRVGRREMENRVTGDRRDSHADGDQWGRLRLPA